MAIRKRAQHLGDHPMMTRSKTRRIVLATRAALNQHIGHKMMTRSKTKKMTSEIASSFPEDIHSQILTRLPVKSLLKFKWVSKSWLALISSRKFVKAHMERCEKKDKTEYNAIVVSRTIPGGDFTLVHCIGQTFFSRKYMNIDHFESKYLTNGHLPRVVGCCNGLCCVLLSGEQFVVSNPFTGENRLVHHVFHEFDRVIWFAPVKIFGFGYDEASDDYKIVAMLRIHVSQPHHVVKIYSLKTNAWKTVDDFLGIHDTFGGSELLGGRGAFVNGKLHWMGDTSKKIVSFDLGTEAVEVVERPSSAKLLYQKMGAIKGCLALYCDNPNEGTEVWVMKEYGIKESWCRVMTVPYIGSSDGDPFNYPLYISKDRVVIADNDNKSALFTYHPKTESIRRLRLTFHETYEVDFCFQSLVSPYLRAEVEADSN